MDKGEKTHKTKLTLFCMSIEVKETLDGVREAQNNMIGGTGLRQEEGGYLKLCLPLGHNPKRVRPLSVGLCCFECE